MMKSEGVFFLADQPVRNFHPRVHQSTRKSARRPLKSCWALQCVQPGATFGAVMDGGVDSTGLNPIIHASNHH